MMTLVKKIQRQTLDHIEYLLYLARYGHLTVIWTVSHDYLLWLIHPFRHAHLDFYFLPLLKSEYEYCRL